MYLFAGKFNHNYKPYAENELWTVTFPDSIKKGNAAIVVCQWTKTADDKYKHNDKWTGKITKAEGSGEVTIDIFKDDSTLYYWFQGTVSSNKDRIDLTVRNPKNEDCGSVKAEVVYKADS